MAAYNDKTVISLHEAAHAVSAIYLKLKLRKATIKPKGRIAGRVEIDPSTQTRVFRRKGDGYVSVDVEAKKRRFFEKQIIMAFAGFACDKLYSRPRWEHIHYSDDRSFIESCRRQGKIPKSELSRLQAEAERLVSLPKMQDAIMSTAHALELAWESNQELPLSIIRSIYKLRQPDGLRVPPPQGRPEETS
jgi:hypothetical protein